MGAITDKHCGYRVKICDNSPLYKKEFVTQALGPMTFAAIDWLSISINLLLVIFVIICLLMTLLILMQRPKQEGLGAAFGGGVTDQVFGARTTNVLQRGTVYLGSAFFILALALAVLIGHQNKKNTLLPDKAAKVEEAKPAEAPKDAAKEEAQPKSLSEELPSEIKLPADAPANTTDAPSPATETVPETPPAAPEAPEAPAAPETPATPEAQETPATPENTSGQP